MKMRKEERGYDMYQTRCIQSISVVALMLALAACENTQELTRQTQEPTKQAQEPTRQAQEPTKGALQLKVTKIGEVSDLVGPSSECDKPDGRKDQGIRLQIPSEMGAKVSYLELLATKKVSGKWASCAAPDAGAWRLAVTEEGSDKPTGNLSKGGVFVLHAADNGAFSDQGTLELKGMDKDGQEVFRLTISG
jgi:hypothetical protein